jgi:lysosomal alpha-mannosidase
MLHRRLLSDDSCGLDEALNETVLKKQGLVVKGVTFMLFETIEKSARLHRDLAHRINNKPIVTFSFGKKENNFKHLSDWSALAGELPSNLHLLTFAKDSDNSIIVRIEHFYEKHEDKNLSNSVTINLKTLFSKLFNFVGVEELSLGTNMKVGELNVRMKWKSDNQFDNDFDQRSETKFRQGNYTDFNFKFNPMQIRTFRLYF